MIHGELHGRHRMSETCSLVSERRVLQELEARKRQLNSLRALTDGGAFYEKTVAGWLEETIPEEVLRLLGPTWLEHLAADELELATRAAWFTGCREVERRHVPEQSEMRVWYYQQQCRYRACGVERRWVLWGGDRRVQESMRKLPPFEQHLLGLMGIHGDRRDASLAERLAAEPAFVGARIEWLQAVLARCEQVFARDDESRDVFFASCEANLVEGVCGGCLVAKQKEIRETEKTQKG